MSDFRGLGLEGAVVASGVTVHTNAQLNSEGVLRANVAAHPTPNTGRVSMQLGRLVKFKRVGHSRVALGRICRVQNKLAGKDIAFFQRMDLSA